MIDPVQERRLRRVFFSTRLLTSLMNCGVRRSSPAAEPYVNLPVLPGLPKDSHVVAVSHDPHRLAIVAVVAHASFDRVMDGCEIPALDGLEAMEFATFVRNERGSYDLKL